MSDSRYELHKPILVIGFFKKKGPFKSFMSLDYVAMGQQMAGLKLEDIGFKIFSIVPDEEHDIPIEYSPDRKVKGYLAHSRMDLPEDLRDLQLKFANQYPRVEYTQISNDLDYRWRLREQNGKNILDPLTQSTLPWDYENLDIAYEGLTILVNAGGGIYEPLLNEIQETLKSDFDAWDITRKEWNDVPGVFFTEVKLKPGIDEEGTESVSGPTTLLPGMTASMCKLSLCDDHPDRLAVKRIAGEVDSFGAEYCHMCQPCYDAYLKAVEEEDRSGCCEWCKQEKPAIRPHRDIEEGSCGPVYDVCDSCIRAERKRFEEELDEDYEN